MARAAYYGTKPALDSAEQAAHVATAAALTSTAASGGEAPTEAEYNALRTDVSNLRTTVVALQAALRDADLQASA